MADAVLKHQIDDTWSVIISGIARESRAGNALNATVILSNGDVKHSDRIAIERVEDRKRFAAQATAEGRPGPETIEDVILQLVPDAIDAVQASGSKKTQADRLVEIAMQPECELFHDRDQNSYGMLSIDSHYETYQIKSRAFRHWLSRQYFEQHNKAPGSQALQDALGVLEGKALYDGSECAVYVRIAEHNGTIYLDLADEQWQYVEIDQVGWRLVARPPVWFRRPRGMLALPVPVSGGALDDLWQYVNLRDRGARILFLAALVAALRPSGPYPLTVLHSPHGSGKSTASGVFRKLIDPNKSDLRAAPKELRDLMIAAGNSHVVAFDNLSHLPPWLSDALCRLSTGGGFQLARITRTPRRSSSRHSARSSSTASRRWPRARTCSTAR